MLDCCYDRLNQSWVTLLLLLLPYLILPPLLILLLSLPFLYFTLAYEGNWQLLPFVTQKLMIKVYHVQLPITGCIMIKLVPLLAFVIAIEYQASLPCMLLLPFLCFTSV
jgi:hypothetical protein